MRGGTKLEGLEVSWRNVANILHALTKVGRWRLDGEEGPMHRYYDKRLFHLPSVEEVLQQYAGFEKVDTADGLTAVGFDVAPVEVGDEGEGDESGPEDGAAAEERSAIDKVVFDKWFSFQLVPIHLDAEQSQTPPPCPLHLSCLP